MSSEPSTSNTVLGKRKKVSFGEPGPEAATSPQTGPNSKKSKPNPKSKQAMVPTSKEPTVESILQDAVPKKRSKRGSRGAKQSRKSGDASTPQDQGRGKGKEKQTNDPNGSEASTGPQKRSKADSAPSHDNAARSSRNEQRIKLAPPRPFPSVPSSSNATGPRSARADGNNMICVTRKTELGAYLRRCKKLVIEDGYKTIHLHAMAAAIPHLVLLATSLPDILPHSSSEIRVDYRTGTVECVDEVFPASDNGDEGDDAQDDEDEDEKLGGDLEKRNKSCLEAIIKIGDGLMEITGKEKKIRSQSRSRGGTSAAQNGKNSKSASNPPKSGGKDVDDAMSSDSDF